MRSVSNRTAPAVSSDAPLTVTVVTVKARDNGPGLPQVVALPCPNIGIESRSGCALAPGRFFLRRVSHPERTEHSHGGPLLACGGQSGQGFCRG